MPDRYENETLEAKLARSHDASLKMIEDKQAEQEGREPNYYWRNAGSSVSLSPQDKPDFGASRDGADRR